MLDKIIQFSIRHKAIIGLFTLVWIGWGIWSATQLPVDAVPDITNNQVQIITATPTLAAPEVEQAVTFPIERSISTVPGLKETRSISRFGLSVVTAIFKENVDIYFARQLINEQLKGAEEEIPKDIGSPMLAPVSTGLGEIYHYLLRPTAGNEEKYDTQELRTLQDWVVSTQLYGIKGVAEVNSFGGDLKQYEVALAPDKLQAMDVSIADIFEALRDNNENTGGAYIDKKPNAYFIRGIGRVHSLKDLRNIAVKTTPGQAPIFIKDVAKVRYGKAIPYGALTYNGKEKVVGGVVMMLKGENSNEVVKNIKVKIPEIQKSLPKDVVIEPYLDRSDLVNRTIHTVEKNLIEGALIVIFVLILFLGNFRAGLIVASAIPLSMLFALGMMKVFGVSANLMSLGAVDFGLIVDGAVIIVEATLHYIEKQKSKQQLSQLEMDTIVETSAEKMMHSAVFGQIIILIVYIPILTLTGIEGKMFVPMAQTVSFAIMGALILSLTYIPMMSSVFLSKKSTHQKTFSTRIMNRLQKLYEPLLRRATKFKTPLIGGTVLFFLLALLVFRGLGGEFIPQLQEGNFAFHCILPQGSSLNQSVETSMHAERIIKSFDEVEMVIGQTGTAEVPTDPMPPEATDLIIVLKDKANWKNDKSYQELAAEMLEKLHNIPGVFFEANQPIQMRFNELMTGVRQDVAVKIFGGNIDTLSVYAQKINQILLKTEGVISPQIEQVSGLPQIDVKYDRRRLANYGINVKQVNDILSTAFAGKKAGEIYENEKRFDLVVRLDTPYRKSIEHVRNLKIPLQSGLQIPLSQVAKVDYKIGPAQISHEDAKRRIVIGFDVPKRDIQSAVKEIRQKIEEQIQLPAGYYFTFGGEFQNLKEASNRLLIAVPAALLLILILLFFAFKSIKEALLIFTAIPMSAIGGVFALWLRGMPFSISAGVGFIALFGVAVLNGVVLIGTFNQLEKEGISALLERTIRGAKERLRPVLMTATVASLGFLPMALSTSAGAEVQKPLATVVIGGLVSATFLTLFVLPLLYLLFNSKIRLNMKSKRFIFLPFLCLIGIATQAQTKIIHSEEEAITTALQNNLGIQSKALEAKSAHEEVKTSGALPKLEINSDWWQFNSHKFDNSLGISQTFPFPTVFGKKKSLLKAEATQKDLENKLEVIRLKRAVRKQYHTLLFLQENEKRLKFLDSLYDEFVRVAELRHQSGEIKKVDVSTAQAKDGKVHLKLRENELKIRKEQKNLQVLLNTSDIPTIKSRRGFLPILIDTTTTGTVLKPHIELQTLTQQGRITSKEIEVQKAKNLPDLTLGYTNQSFVGMETIHGVDRDLGLGNRFHSFQVGISVPLFTKSSAQIKALHLSKEANRMAVLQRQKEWKIKLENIKMQYKQNLKEYDYYRKVALQNAKDIISAAQLAYKSGETGFSDYVMALDTATGIELDYLKVIKKINETALQIYYLTNQ